MNSYEEELQKNLERGQTPKGDELDVKAYRQVFQTLRKDPGYDLAGSFAERVVARVISRQESKDSTAYLWFAAGIFLLVIASVATILFVGFRFDFGFLSEMAEYKGLALFGTLLILLLNWLDKRLIRGRRVSF